MNVKAERCFLGIDSGTQGVKVIVLGEDSGLLAEGRASHALITNERGGREQEPRWWIEALQQAVREALHNTTLGRQIVAIGVSAQQHGFVPLDRAGQVIRPAKLWNDTETAPQAQALTEALGGVEAVVQEVGNAMAPGYTAPKLRWLKEHEVEHYERLHTVLLPHDMLNFWLTGELRMEWGDASGTAFFDVVRRDWSIAVLRAIDAQTPLEERLPPCGSSREAVGTLRQEVVEALGLSPGTLVAAGGGDNMMAAIGTGNVEEGIVTASLGTSGTIFAHTKQPLIDPVGELAAFCSSDDAWLPLACTMNVTVSTELHRTLLGLSVEELNHLAAEASPGAGGLCLLPYFHGERTPSLPHAHAVLAGLTATNYTRANLCRAAMEGPTLGLRYALETLTRQGLRPRTLRVVGGGAQSALWRQLLADLLGCEVALPKVSEAAALGAALQAMWCFHTHSGDRVSLPELAEQYVHLDAQGSAEPQAENMCRYEEVYARYRALGEALRRTWEPLSAT